MTAKKKIVEVRESRRFRRRAHTRTITPPPRDDKTGKFVKKKRKAKRKPSQQRMF